MNMEGSLVVTYKTGVDENGQDVTISRTFRNLNPNASVAAIYATAQAIGSLLGYELFGVERVVRESL